MTFPHQPNRLGAIVASFTEPQLQVEDTFRIAYQQPHLTSLNLGQNPSNTTIGFSAVSSMLRKPDTSWNLEHLHLDANRIGEKAAVILTYSLTSRSRTLNFLGQIPQVPEDGDFYSNLKMDRK